MGQEQSKFIAAVANSKMEFGIPRANAAYSDFIDIAMGAKPMLEAMRISIDKEEIDAHVVLKIGTPLGEIRVEKVIFLGDDYPEAAAVFSHSSLENGVDKRRDLGVVCLHSIGREWILTDGTPFAQPGYGYTKQGVVSAINFAVAQILRFNTERLLNAGIRPLP
jgi:hypothetical protein